MLFVEVVTTSAAVAATSSRSAKRDALADLLRRLDPAEVAPVTAFLVGAPRQGRIGVGWRTLAAVAAGPAPWPTLTISDVDAAIEVLAGLAGPGSGTARHELVADLLARATADEAAFLAALLGGELRQGSLAGVMTDAVAAASGAPVATVRRAVMLGGRLDVVATLALAGGEEALGRVGLEPGRPLQPMLASTAASVGEAIVATGESSVEWKLDGIRIQVHRVGDDVRVWTRNLNEITDRLPAVVRVVRGLSVDRVVLDGEALGIDQDGRPRLFQDTVRRDGDSSGEDGLLPFFFDLLHLDGEDLIDRPLRERRALLGELTADRAIPSSLTADPVEGEAVLTAALAAGHEGVVVKAAGSAYEAGRRGKAWRKVKPVHTLDLVVLAVEWGHGRRRGLLSNLHLGARSDDDGFVMVGKTFKGLTDELLRWQTERFLALADGPVDRSADHGVVTVRPEQVVEIAVDGVQRSTRYTGGVALRFARVVRYREDRSPESVDRISTVRAML